jgi:hypothetical protein
MLPVRMRTTICAQVFPFYQYTVQWQGFHSSTPIHYEMGSVIFVKMP